MVHARKQDVNKIMQNPTGKGMEKDMENAMVAGVLDGAM